MSMPRSPTNIGRPMRPMRGKLSGEVPAMRTGGWGCWTGRGETVTFWNL